jgi:hypothetical protein
MRKLVHFALTALFLSSIASAQNLPAIDVFGGYSYLSFDLPSNPSTGTSSQRLALNGWEVSASVGLFHHLAAEADFSGHQQGNCEGTTVNCSNFSYMFGPRFTIGDRAGRITGFVHGLAGRDRFDSPISAISVTDTSVAAAAGAGLDYWLFRHVGVQLGPVDYIYTNHLNVYGVSSQSNYRASGGIVFRFGGELPPSEPKPPKKPKAESGCKPHRSLKRPWHKTKCPPSETQPTTTQPTTSAPPTSQPSTAPSRQPAPPAPSVPSRGMPINSLGVVVAPQEFDGARILEIVPGGVAEMASLKAGDLIKSVDGKTVRTPMELAAELSDKSGKVRIGIMRGSFSTETVILLGTR